MEHPQKLALVLDDQSLTYAELLHSSQLLAHHLTDRCQIQPDDIVAQCVDRSIEMIIGILSILMSGASYCPLSPNQPSARLLSLIEQVKAKCVLSPASYAQVTVWLSERTRFFDWPKLLPTYNMSKIFKIDSGYLLINQLLRAIDSIVAKHWIFRTQLMFDAKSGLLRQSIHDRFTYPIRISTINDEQEQAKLLHEEMWTPFDTEHDGVFRCHLIQYDHNHQKDRLSNGDLVVFYFHHGSFDGRAIDLFLGELKVAYSGGELQSPCLQYIDYSFHERKLAMTEARNYWSELLQDYGWDRQLNLGGTKKPMSARRTSRGEQLTVAVPSTVAHSMILSAHQLNVTLFQLGLTCFYLFLTQISFNNRDACIGVIHMNRYRPEIASMIGMFVNILPCRIRQIDLDQLSFIELVHKVQQTFLTSVQHAHLPYDELINLHRIPTTHLQFPYLQTLFSVDTILIDYINMDNILLGDSCYLSNYKTNEKDLEIGYKFDLDVSFAYDKRTTTINCTWAYMFDVFERETIQQHANSFIELLTQLFGSTRAEQLQLPLGEIITLDKNKADNDNQVTTLTN
ncbi:unnamed protein product [Rotaria sp. Silwood1]|nr:unnamed protein product [Rotaria sp. Silwood1]